MRMAAACCGMPHAPLSTAVGRARPAAAAAAACQPRSRVSEPLPHLPTWQCNPIP